MTFSVSRDRGLFEWAGTSLLTVFCQPSRLLDPSMWRLIYDVLRFNACARRLIVRGKNPTECSIGEYLTREGYSDAFRDNYLIVRGHLLPDTYDETEGLFTSLTQPMTAAIWSTPPDKCAMDFPARTLVRAYVIHVTRDSHLTLNCVSLTDSIFEQPSPTSNHRKAFVAYHQRGEVYPNTPCGE